MIKENNGNNNNKININSINSTYYSKNDNINNNNDSNKIIGMVISMCNFCGKHVSLSKTKIA